MTRNMPVTEKDTSGSDAHARVRRKPLECGYCGYDLRSHGVNDTCPECQKPVHNSIVVHERRLDRVDRWRDFAMATVMNVWLTVLAILALVLVMALAGSYGGSSRNEILALVLPFVLVLVVYFYRKRHARNAILNLVGCLVLIVILRLAAIAWIDMIGAPR